MSKKVPKSLQAIVVTFIVGMLLPNAFTLTGNALADKLTWKITLAAVFSFSTVIVGLLYSAKFIKGRTSGGKARIGIYLLTLIIICSMAMPFLIAFAQAIQWIIYAVGLIALIGIFALIVSLIVKISHKKKKFKSTQQDSVLIRQVNYKDQLYKNKRVSIVSHTAQNQEPIANYEVEKKTSIADAKAREEIFEEDKKDVKLINKRKTLYELWNNRNAEKKCLTATNDENPDLEWVKIYKPPYANSKFYGYVKMIDAHNTVNGEIYFTNRSIWRECD